MTTWFPLGPTPPCVSVCAMQVLNRTTSGTHKFKVTGVMTNEYLGQDSLTYLNDEAFLVRKAGVNGWGRQCVGGCLPFSVCRCSDPQMLLSVC